MSYWPRLFLTPEEVKAGNTKYFDPNRAKSGVLYRSYQGSLETNETQRRPIWNFQIARRCRVFALTGIGDVHQLRMQFQDATGETYFVDPLLASQVFGGWSASGLQLPATTPTVGSLPDVGTAQRSVGMAFSLSPFVFEPNIVLRPNQVLNIIGEAVTPYDAQAYRVDMVIHVWEFPRTP